jgi:hypothetical protein
MIVSLEAEQISVIGENVNHAVTMIHGPATRERRLPSRKACHPSGGHAERVPKARIVRRAIKRSTM